MVASEISLVSEARYALNKRRAESDYPELFEILDGVKDPEVPVLSIWDLGILQNVVVEDEAVIVTITPTYSGCPAMAQIESDIKNALSAAGYPDVIMAQQLVPAWTTDWLDVEAKRRLRAYGVAPPDEANCPQCGSSDTVVISEFGSTSCKAQMRCNSCLEPFDQFKKF